MKKLSEKFSYWIIEISDAHPHRQDNFLMQKYDSFYFSQETAVIGDNEEYLDNNMDSETAPVVRSMFGWGNSWRMVSLCLSHPYFWETRRELNVD